MYSTNIYGVLNNVAGTIIDKVQKQVSFSCTSMNFQKSDGNKCSKNSFNASFLHAD